jgi:hypothetical protein
MVYEFNEYPEIEGIYEHYKGGKYEVIAMSKHSETDELLVIYKSVHFGGYHVRPLESWNETIGETTTKAGLIVENGIRFKRVA